MLGWWRGHKNSILTLWSKSKFDFEQKVEQKVENSQKFQKVFFCCWNVGKAIGCPN